MKHLFLIAITLLLCGNVHAQKTDLLKDKILVGKLKGDSAKLVLDTKSFLKAMNEQFPDKDFDKVEIKHGQTIGDKKVSFYYLRVSGTGPSMRRWLGVSGNKLYIENSDMEDVSYKDYYFSCSGSEQCSPNLYVEGNQMDWICGDDIAEVKYQEAERNPCMKETSIVVVSDF
jgi:hypothetical protein